MVVHLKEALVIDIKKILISLDYDILLIVDREGLYFFAILLNELAKCFIDISSCSSFLSLSYFSFIPDGCLVLVVSFYLVDFCSLAIICSLTAAIAAALTKASISAPVY